MMKFHFKALADWLQTFALFMATRTDENKRIKPTLRKLYFAMTDKETISRLESELVAERQRRKDAETEWWAMLQRERQRREQAEVEVARLAWKIDSNDQTKIQLLSALTAIEKHNDFWKNPAFQVDQIEVDLSLLHDHDAELKAESEVAGWHKGFDDCNKANEENKARLIVEVRKPLVDALAKVEQ